MSASPTPCEWTEAARPAYEGREKNRGHVIDEQTTLDALLRRCAAADRSALRELYDRESSRLYGLALRITRQPSLAADAVQDTFLQVWQQAGRFDPSRGAAGAWLASLARYRAIDIARRRMREQPGYEAPEQEDPAPDALTQLVGSFEAEALRRCLATLDDKRRQLIVMAFVDGLSHSELAERLAAPLGSIKSWIRRSLAALKTCLTS
jgi:RNA polymerase sigma-70 factor (ECF subfamily)